MEFYVKEEEVSKVPRHEVYLVDSGTGNVNINIRTKDKRSWIICQLTKEGTLKLFDIPDIDGIEIEKKGDNEEEYIKVVGECEE